MKGFCENSINEGDKSEGSIPAGKKKIGKERLDSLLVRRGFSQSRERAKAIIMAGQVLANGVKVDKAGALVDSLAEIKLLGNDIPYVSRGGLKLEKAIDSFGISMEGKISADIGASTGGFTDCMLKGGAAKVFAVDVGYGQLAWSLRQDPRVVSMERTNARYLTPDDVGELLDFASIDVSFISLDKILPAVKELLKENGEIVALIKPQFEAGKDKVGKKGVVRDPAVHEQVIFNVLDKAKQIGLFPSKLTFSPVKGPEGNIEYLLLLGKTACEEIDDCTVKKAVADAHCELDV